jgi:hypothetical protein
MRTASSEPKRGGTETQDRLSPPPVPVDGKHCPSCGGYISFAKVYGSSFYRFKCPHCGSSLAYEARSNIYALGFLGYAVSVIGLVIASPDLSAFLFLSVFSFWQLRSLPLCTLESGFGLLSVASAKISV